MCTSIKKTLNPYLPKNESHAIARPLILNLFRLKTPFRKCQLLAFTQYFDNGKITEQFYCSKDLRKTSVVSLCFLLVIEVLCAEACHQCIVYAAGVRAISVFPRKLPCYVED